VSSKRINRKYFYFRINSSANFFFKFLLPAYVIFNYFFLNIVSFLIYLPPAILKFFILFFYLINEEISTDFEADGYYNDGFFKKET